MKYLISSFVLLTVACSGSIPAPAETPQQSSEISTECAVHSATDVQMWINAMPGPNDNPTLLTTFKVTTSTPGYTFALEELQVRESYPPQYVFGLITRPPDGIVTQVETVTDVRLEIPNFAYDQIASASVNCGNTTLFTVDAVETVY